MNILERIFGRSKYIIGCVHFLPLPGTPGYDEAGGMRAIIARALEDATRLEQGGVDGILFANEADTPYQQRVGPEIVAAFTRCVAEAAPKIALPFGINMLLDPVAGMAVAHASGARFLRGYFTGTYVGDTSLMDSRGAEALRLRRYIGADVAAIANATCGFGATLDPRDLAAVAHGAVTHGRVDALSVSGLAAGNPASFEAVAKAKAGAGGVPVLIGTGATRDNIRQFLDVADGAIVATAFKQDDKTLNPVDPVRVQEFMAVVRAARNG